MNVTTDTANTRQRSAGRSHRLRRRLAGAALAVASVAGISWVNTPVAEATLPQLIDIVSHDGVKIQSVVFTPDGPGPHPIIVAPSSWSSFSGQYAGTAALWATQGYVVVSYASRGFGLPPQQGFVDIAGPDTVKDVTAVIDWAVENANGDPERVGAIGVSYGAGISLLAAGSEGEDRIDAVVALSTWSSLEDALYPNQTLNTGAIDLLLQSGVDGPLSSPGPELLQIAEEYEQGEISYGLEIAPSRSPINSVDRLNERDVAVMIGNGWSDSFFAPSGAVELFEALDGPKKLALSPGDHGGPELGAIGVPTERMNQAFDWIQRHVGGVNVNTGPTVEVTTNDADRDRVTANSFDDLTTFETTLHLTQPRSERHGWWPFYWYTPKHGELQSRTNSGWNTSIRGGRSTTADSMSPVGISLLSGYLHHFLRIAPTVIPSTINRSNAAVWESGRYWDSRTIAGIPELQLSVRPEQRDTTFIVYLYEKNVAEVATLVTHKAYTLRDATPGQIANLSVELEPTMWELERGSRLYMVIDTVDPRYQSETSGGNVRFMSRSNSPATLTVPFR